MMEKGWLNEEKIIRDLKELNDKSQICDICRYYNSNIPCGLTPSVCKKADKFANEFVDGLKKLKPKDEPQKHCHRPNNMACHPEQDDMWCRGCDYWYANEPQTDGYISGEDFMKIFSEPHAERGK